MGLTWSWEIWFLLAQLMGIITICFEFASYQIKNQRKYLLVTSIGNIFWMLMFVFIGLQLEFNNVLPLIFAAGLGVMRGFIFWWAFGKNTKRRKLIGRITLYASIAIALPFTIIAITRMEFVTQQVLNSFGLVAALLFIIGQYLPSKHYLRAFTFLYAAFVFLGSTPIILRSTNEHGVIVHEWNYIGMAIELTKIISIIIFYIILMRRHWMVKKLKEIKIAIACEVNKISACSSAQELTSAGVVSGAELEKLAAKMVRYELITIEKTEITDLRNTDEKMGLILDDIKTVQDVKDAIQAVIKLDRQNLEEKIPTKWGSVQEAMTATEPTPCDEQQ